MRRSASEVIRELEMRIARLERQSNNIGEVFKSGQKATQATSEFVGAIKKLKSSDDSQEYKKLISLLRDLEKCLKTLDKATDLASR